ncbi:MAG: carbonic anhydrase family protein [Polyangiales bacterium]
MSLRSFLGSALGTAIVLGSGIGCASKSCPPCDAAALSAKKAETSGAESASGEYYALPGLEHGLLQSPVNILSGEVDDRRHTIQFNLGDGAGQVENLGHTVQLSFRKDVTVEFDGNTYEFMQLHFHTPSEHLIDGITYPMEIHFVHSRPGLSADDPPNYLVVALLFRMGGSNRFLEEFLDAIPTEEGRSAELKGVMAEDVLGPDLDVESIHFFHYRGSLTTPPYTESVHWMIAKEIIEAGQAQIQRIQLIEGDNARHVQRLQGRETDE